MKVSVIVESLYCSILHTPFFLISK